MTHDFVKITAAVYYEYISKRFHIFAKITTSLNSREMHNDGIIRI